MAHAFRQGDHICSICDTEEERLRTAAAYLADGLRRGERCVYIGATRAVLQRFDVALQAAGLDAAALTERGVLIELTHAEAHLIDGRFDCERMLTMIDDAVRQAIADGFSGLRVCGDMSWLLLEAPGSAEVGEYEARLNQFFANTRSAAMCQYNRQRLPPPLIDMALATHSTVVVAGQHKFNPFFQAGRDATIESPESTHSQRPTPIRPALGVCLAVGRWGAWTWSLIDTLLMTEQSPAEPEMLPGVANRAIHHLSLEGAALVWVRPAIRGSGARP